MDVGEEAGEDEGDTAKLAAASIRAEEDRTERINDGRSFEQGFHGDWPERGPIRPG